MKQMLLLPWVQLVMIVMMMTTMIRVFLLSVHLPRALQIRATTVRVAAAPQACQSDVIDCERRVFTFSRSDGSAPQIHILELTNPYHTQIGGQGGEAASYPDVSVYA